MSLSLISNLHLFIFIFIHTIDFCCKLINREIAENVSHKAFINNNIRQNAKYLCIQLTNRFHWNYILHSPHILTKFPIYTYILCWVSNLRYSFNGSLLNFGRFSLFVSALSDICIRYENLQSRTIDRYIRYKRFTTRSDWMHHCLFDDFGSIGCIHYIYGGELNL